MIATLQLLTYPSACLVTHVFCVCWEYLGSILLEMSSVQHDMNYSHIAAHHISRTYLSCIAEALYPLTNIPSFPTPQLLATTSLLSAFMVQIF